MTKILSIFSLLLLSSTSFAQIDNTEHSIALVATGFECADLNGDLSNDFLIQHNYDLYWMSNDGVANFSIEDTLDFEFVEDFRLFDGDNDGDMDVGVIHRNIAGFPDNWWVLSYVENLGSGSFAAPVDVDSTELSFPQKPTLGVVDVNGDALEDILVSNTMRWYENLGGAFTFGVSTPIPAFYETFDVTMDLDGDGLRDLLMLPFGFGVHIFKLNNGDGTFGDDLSIPIFPTLAYEQLDINGDGDLDFIGWGSTSQIHGSPYNCEGLYADPYYIAGTFGNFHALHTADLTGDGQEEILIGSSLTPGLRWSESLGPGLYNTPVPVGTLPGSTQQTIDCKDLDGDGDLDPIVMNSTLVWYENLFGVQPTGCTDPADCNYDPVAVIDDGTCDTDCDGLNNSEEEAIGTDPTISDTDGDGLTDFDEEYIWASDPLRMDTDFDGLADGLEVNLAGTDPTLPDSDFDGCDDNLEYAKECPDNSCGTCPGDINADLSIDTQDLLAFLGVFGTVCP